MIVWLPHPEVPLRTGYASWDGNTGFFTCRTCGFELEGVQPCLWGCGGVMRFDGREFVCGSDGGHRATAELMLAAPR